MRCVLPKFALGRYFDPAMTRAQLDGMAIANLAALSSYIYRGGTTPRTDDHGLRWIRSYWQQGGTWGMCLYESPDVEALIDFQTLCGAPFVDIREVVEIEGDTLPAAVGDRIALSLRLTEADAQDPAAALAGFGGSAPDGYRPGLIRAYWDAKERMATALFETSDPSSFEHVVASTAPEARPALIIEVTPDEYQ